MKNLVTCKNCEEQFKENFKFCPFCGQQAIEKLTVGILFYNTLSNYLSFDARFFRSLIPLLFKPGYLASKFISGKRMLYLHPAKMYLFSTVVFFFLFSFIQKKHVFGLNKAIEKGSSAVLNIDDVREQAIKDSITHVNYQNNLKQQKYIPNVIKKKMDSMANPANTNKELLKMNYVVKEIDSLIAINADEEVIYKVMGKEGDGWFEKRFYRQSLRLYKSKQGGSILQTFYNEIPIALFFLLPIFALIINMLFKKKGGYAHHLVFSFYFFAFVFLVFSFVIGTNFIWNVPNWIDWVLVLSTFIYFIISLNKFYKESKFRTFYKACITGFVFSALIIPMAIVTMVVFSFLFY